MPEIKLFYRNCNCCSGSGSSGSGSSGSGSGDACACQFFYGTPCDGAPIATCDGTDLVATVTFDFADCAGSNWSQCSGSSGSSSGGPTTGGDFEPTGSSSGSCSQDCPTSCCDLLPRHTFNVKCVGGMYASENLFDVADGDPGFLWDDACAGYRSDKEAWMHFAPFGADGAWTGALFIPVDGFGLIFLFSQVTINFVSCNPLQINATGYCTTPTYNIETQMPCMYQCMSEQYGGLCCVKANLVITEA